MMIVEGIVTTIGQRQQVHIAAMGAVVEDPPPQPLRGLVLRPYQRTTTLANVKRTGQAVFHVTDNVEMLARAAVGRLDPQPELIPARGIEGWVVADACRWYALRVRRLDDSSPRAEIEADVVECGRLRDFLGWNRAKHAVVEAAILATRTKLLSAAAIREEMVRLAVLVGKTGGAAERSAFSFLEGYLAEMGKEAS